MHVENGIEVIIDHSTWEAKPKMSVHYGEDRTWRMQTSHSSAGVIMALFGSRYNCSVLGIVTTLTTNYGVKQSQFTKPTLEPLR